jgi:hypothetical protein
MFGPAHCALWNCCVSFDVTAHALAFESAKLIQHDPPSLPPRFDEDVAPLTPSRRAVLPAVTFALVGALVVAASAVCLSGLPWTIRNEIADGEGKKTGAISAAPMKAYLSSRIDTAMADLLREDLNASEEK